jgi:hypothetical protein
LVCSFQHQRLAPTRYDRVSHEPADPSRHKPDGDDISLMPEFLFWEPGVTHPHLPAAQVRALMTRHIPRPGPSFAKGGRASTCVRTCDQTPDNCRLLETTPCRVSAATTIPARSALVGCFSLPRTENPRVGGSIPSLAISFHYKDLAPLETPRPARPETEPYSSRRVQSTTR